ncbi:hypothetical protein MJD09_01735 [bacterium]|nr:hypothetical protein [bacterium]
MSKIYGIWKHEMKQGDSVSVITQSIREDGSYETHMIYAIGAGCQQHTRHRLC